MLFIHFTKSREDIGSYSHSFETLDESSTAWMDGRMAIIVFGVGGGAVGKLSFQPLLLFFFQFALLSQSYSVDTLSSLEAALCASQLQMECPQIWGVFPHFRDCVRCAAIFTAGREKKQWLVHYHSQRHKHFFS